MAKEMDTRITLSPAEDETKEMVRVSAGSPTVLRGRVGNKWRDIAVISSNGGRVFVKKNTYTDYALDEDTNKRMTFEPPKVTAIQPKKKRQPKIIKETK